MHILASSCPCTHVHKLTHAHQHTHTYARPHTRMHTPNVTHKYTRTHMLASHIIFAHAPMHPCASHTCTNMPSLHARAHRRTHMHTRTHTHASMHAHKCIHTRTCTRTHTHASMHAHKCTYTRTCTRTHMRACTHKNARTHTHELASHIIFAHPPMHPCASHTCTNMPSLHLAVLACACKHLHTPCIIILW